MSRSESRKEKKRRAEKREKIEARLLGEITPYK
jgi:hypothetical protein